MSVVTVPQPSLGGSDLNFQAYIHVLRRRKAIFLQVFVMIMAVGLVVTAMSKPVYQTQAKFVVPVVNRGLTIQSLNDPLAVLNQFNPPDAVSTQLQVIQSSPFLDEAARNAKITHRAGTLYPSLKAEAMEANNMVLLTTEGGDPKEVTDLTNAAIDLHVHNTELNSNQGLENTTDWIRSERDKALKSLDEAEKRLLSFRKAHRVVQQTAEQDARAKEFIELDAKVRETGNEILSLKTQITDLQQRIQKEPLDLVREDTKDNPRIAKLQDRLDDLNLQRETLLANYKPTSPNVKEIDNQIQALNTRLQAEPKVLTERTHSPNSTRPALESKLAELNATLEGLIAVNNAAKAQRDSKRSFVDNLGPWEVQQARLTHDRDAAQSAYNRLTDSLHELEIRNRIKIPMVRVVERAVLPVEPIRPKKAINIALTFFLALFLATGMSFLQEFLDDRINTPDDLNSVSQLPALTHVPMLSSEQPRLVNALPANSQVAEAYRGLRSSIGFAAINAPLKRLLITSSSKGEGKSVTSVNLATAMAMDGKRVILVDADMRRPSIHRLVECPVSPGLSEVLIGMKTLGEVLQPTDVPNLQVVCAGPIPPNPAELLNSPAFNHLLEELDARADVVLFDSPPCIPVTDPLVIAGRMDGVVLVLHVGQTRKAAVRRATELLQRAHARVIGTVFNQVQEAKTGYYYYYYYYASDGYYSEDDGANRRSNGRKTSLASGTTLTARGTVVKPRNEED